MVLLICLLIIPALSPKWEASFEILLELHEILKAIRDRLTTRSSRSPRSAWGFPLSGRTKAESISAVLFADEARPADDADARGRDRAAHQKGDRFILPAGDTDGSAAATPERDVDDLSARHPERLGGECPGPCP